MVLLIHSYTLDKARCACSTMLKILGNDSASTSIRTVKLEEVWALGKNIQSNLTSKPNLKISCSIKSRKVGGRNVLAVHLPVVVK